jgi:hypothetical protein
MIGMPAGATAKNRLALTVIRCAMPAGMTDLRRVRRVDLLHPARRLLLQPGHQLSPAGTLTTTTDILRRERRFLPGLKAGVSTPRNR